MFCFGRTFNAFPAKFVWLHMHTFKTSSPLPSITGEKPSSVVEGGILPLLVHLWGWPPGRAQHLGTFWPWGDATGDLCQSCCSLHITPASVWQEWDVGCSVHVHLWPPTSLDARVGQQLREAFEDPYGFRVLDFVVCLCYSSCGWGEQVELARSCLAQVLSTL